MAKCMLKLFEKSSVFFNLDTRGVAKYTDFGPIDGYISETVQDRR